MGSDFGRDTKRVSTRRNFLIVCGALGVMAGWRAVSPFVADRFAGDFDFRDIDGLPGFRKIGDGAISAASIDPFFGLEEDRVAPAPLPGSIVDALHFRKGPGVPVAEFTDYNCPYCKILGERVHALADAGEITVSLHHLPQLGPGSIAASRVVLAAENQHEGDALHRRIMASRFRVDENYARATARDQGFDVNSLDLTIGTAHLARAKTLASKFGIIGTPALVVGRTLVIGEISERRLARLIVEERSSI